MKTYLAASFIFLFVASGEAYSQIKIPRILTTKNSTSGLTENEAGQGIKEALTQGVTNAVLNLNKTDGFFGSEVYKLFLPPDALKIEKSLRKAGMGPQVDKAILAINRGAEDADEFDKPIFVAAIKASMF